MVAVPRPAEPRFWAAVDKRGPDECWPWTRPVNGMGYGGLSVDGKTVGAHRFAYALLVRPLSDHDHVDHTCHNSDPTCLGGPSCLHRRCLNPRHLDAVPQAENNRRAFQQALVRRPTCPRGHARTPENRIRSGRGTRCRLCHIENESARRLQKAATS